MFKLHSELLVLSQRSTTVAVAMLLTSLSLLLAFSLQQHKGAVWSTQENFRVTEGGEYRYALRKDVSANDGLHIRRWSHKFIIL